MLAVSAVRTNADDPLSCLDISDLPTPEPPPGWVRVRVQAASLNHHDLWTLRGVGTQKLPVVLGCDAAGILDDGSEVVVHSVIGDSDAGRGDETLDPKRSLLSEQYDGTFAEFVVVPQRNLIPKPAALSWEEAACLPTAWLTAYRMLFNKGRVRPGDRVLIQGAGGGVTTAAIMLARAAGAHVYVTSRDEGKRARALGVGAHEALETGARLPERVDVVLETVGKATWSHSLKSLRPGGTLVVSGATSGPDPSADLSRVFFLQLNVVGSTMGTRDELAALTRFCVDSGVRPLIDSALPLADARTGFERMASGELFGKVVFRLS